MTAYPFNIALLFTILISVFHLIGNTKKQNNDLSHYFHTENKFLFKLTQNIRPPPSYNPVVLKLC